MAKKVVIDSGHGGVDGGSSGNGILEKEYTLKISNYIKKRLDELGIENAMTRTSDELLDQSARPKRAQSFFGKGDDVIVLSNHLNAGGGDGAEIIYALRNSDALSKLIAKELESSGQNVRKYYQRRLPSNPSKDYYYLLRDTPNNETLIVEYGFLDSTGDDVNLIKNNWEDLAEAVVKALANYIGVPYSLNDDSDYYVVTKGDSLWSIAKKYNMTVDELKSINNLNSNLLSIGQRLKIKGSNDNQNIYIVQKGDTLYKIANMYETTVDNLKTLNNLKSNNLSIGQKLIVPSKNKIYIVQKGDSLWSIARKYGTTVDSIKKKNNLSTNVLQIGQKLKI